MPDNDIKNIVKLFSEISDLIIDLENKHRLASNLLINLILENQKRISQLEQQISGVKGVPVSEISISADKTMATSTPETQKVDLTDVLTELGLDEKQPTPASVSPVPVERKSSKVSDIISLKESTATSILSSEASEESETAAVGKTPTVSRYGSVAVLKKQSGSSKFRPRTPPPPKPKPKPKAEGPPPKKQNKEALAMLDSLKTQISEETHLPRQPWHTTKITKGMNRQIDYLLCIDEDSEISWDEAKDNLSEFYGVVKNFRLVATKPAEQANATGRSNNKLA